MRQVNLEVKKLTLQGTDEGKVHVVMSFTDVPNILGFEVTSVEKLHEFLKTFDFQDFENIKYMRGVLDDNNSVIAYAHITKDKVFNLITPVEDNSEEMT